MVGGLGKLIVQRRRDLGLSQQDLARMLGVPAANLSQLEHSASRWRSRLIPALADALQVSQLELALTAGIIDDLPPYPSAEGSNEIDDPLYPALSRDPMPHEQPEIRLGNVVKDLTPDEIEFLLAVSATFLRHHQSGESKSVSRASNGDAHIVSSGGREHLVEIEL
jgi:transcriptional regulator with XRE-family HTH domain